MNSPVNIRFPDGVNAYCPVFREIGSIRAILLSLACETATILKSTFARLPFVLQDGRVTCKDDRTGKRLAWFHILLIQVRTFREGKKAG